MKWIALVLMLIMAAPAYAADVKITELPAATAVTSDDLTIVVDAPGGSAATKKITISDFFCGGVAIASGNAFYYDGTNIKCLTYGSPISADGTALGSATLEWSDLYLASGAVIYGQSDQSSTLTSTATGWEANLAFTGNAWLYTKNGNSSAGGVRFYEKSSEGANYVDLRPADAVTGDYIVTLPASVGTLMLTTGSPAGMVIASQAAGDLLYASSSSAWARLAVAGQPGYTLTSGTTAGGTTPLWQAPGAAGTFYRGAGTTTTPTWSTSTLADTYVQGGLLHAATANTIAALSPGAVGSFLMSNGAAAALSYLAAGAANYILVGAGTTTIPVWTAPTGTGAPVLANTPTLITPVIGAATGTSLIATGIVDGLTNITLATDGSEDANVSGKMSHVIINKHTTEATALAITLPATAIAGMQLLVKNGYGDNAVTTGVITIFVPATHYAWNPTTKTQCAQGYDLVSGGAAGDYIGMIAIAADKWESIGYQGTWTCTATP